MQSIQAADARSSTLSSPPLALVLAGMLVGIVGWNLVEKYYSYGHIPDAIVEQYAADRNPENRQLMDKAWYWSGVRNGGLLVGGFGMLLATSFILIEVMARRTRHGVIIALAVGVGLALLLGMASGATAQAVYRLLKDRHNDPMYKTILVHMTAWLPIALACGIGIGVLARDYAVTLRTSAGAMGGALLAAMLYSPLAGIMYPNENSELLVPFGTGNRLLWMVLTGCLIGLFSGVAGRYVAPKPSPQVIDP